MNCYTLHCVIQALHALLMGIEFILQMYSTHQLPYRMRFVQYDDARTRGRMSRQVLIMMTLLPVTSLQSRGVARGAFLVYNSTYLKAPKLKFEIIDILPYTYSHIFQES